MKLFVRNLPYSTTNESLTNIFAVYGPLKNCFVVHDSDNKCRGFGYVTENAIKAKSCIKAVGNRPVQILFANKKNVSVIKQGGIHQKTEKRQSCYEIVKTIVIRYLHCQTTMKQLRVRCRKIGTVLNIEYPVPDKDQSTAYVTFKSSITARKAVKALNKRSLNGNQLEVKLLSKDIKFIKQCTLKKSRVIIRNISFQCKESELTELFSHYGTVINSHIPLNENNQSLGYGFVQLSSYLEAQNCIKQVNASVGRQIAVDWVIARDKYQYQLKTLQEHVEHISSEEIVKEHVEHVSSEEIDQEHVEHISSEEIDQEHVEHVSSEEIDQEHVEHISSEEIDQEHEQLNDVCNEVTKPNDVHKGRTIFIRNLPFDVNSTEIFDIFKCYGPIVYCKLVINPKTNLCKGTAFVQYKKLESVTKCILDSTSNEGIWCRHNKLNVCVAVAKEQLLQIKKVEKQEKLTQRDKRNLYLLNEGYIDPSSDTAKQMSKSDLNKRQKSFIERKKKLKNLYYFISKTRLSIRNLPTAIDEKSLKSIVKDHCNLGHDIKQIKLIRSKEKYTQDGLGRSLGYGFIGFKNHHCALTTLRILNNNPEIFGIEKRPIVEFAIEDSRALKLMEKRRDNSLKDPIKCSKRIKWQIKWKEKRLNRKKQQTLERKESRQKTHDSKRPIKKKLSASNSNS